MPNPYPDSTTEASFPAPWQAGKAAVQDEVPPYETAIVEEHLLSNYPGMPDAVWEFRYEPDGNPDGRCWCSYIATNGAASWMVVEYRRAHLGELLRWWTVRDAQNRKADTGNWYHSNEQVMTTISCHAPGSKLRVSSKAMITDAGYVPRVRP